MSLTHKQQRFVIEYLQCFNATEAAKKAGYQCEREHTFASIGSENLTKPEIKKLIDAFFAAYAMPASEVIARLSDQARGNISEFLMPTGGIDWEAVHKKGELIKRVVHHKGQKTQIELHDAQAALQLLGKHYGLFVDRKEITGAGGGPVVLVNGSNIDLDDL